MHSSGDHSEFGQPAGVNLVVAQPIIAAAERIIRRLRLRYQNDLRLLAKSQYCIQSSRLLLERLEEAQRRWWFPPLDSASEPCTRSAGSTNCTDDGTTIVKMD